MLNLEAIADRVDRGMGTQDDMHLMLDELRELYAKQAPAQQVQPPAPLATMETGTATGGIVSFTATPPVEELPHEES